MGHESDRSFRLYEEGRAAMERKDFRIAIECFRKSVSLSPHFKTCELLGECLSVTGQLQEAVVYLSAAAGLGNGQFRARYLLAKVLLALGDAQLAAEKLDEALALNPNYEAAKQLRTKILAENEGIKRNLAKETE